MAGLLVIKHEDNLALPVLVERAATALANAKTSAEVLEARDMASIAYDVAKKTARIAAMKGAHDELIAAVYRSQADALVIEAQAKRRLADEYDAAQKRGEVRRTGERTAIAKGNSSVVSETGLSSFDVFQARQIRDAEVKEPGIVRRTVDQAIANREEPTKAKVRRAVKLATNKKREGRRTQQSERNAFPGLFKRSDEGG